MTSASVSNFISGATGPKVSSRMASMSGPMSRSTVGI